MTILLLLLAAYGSALGRTLVQAILSGRRNLLIVVVGLGLSSTACLAGVEDAVVMVEGCSGVCVDHTGLVLTARHCNLPTTVTVRFKDRTVSGTRVDEATFNAKLAILRDEVTQIEESLGNATTLEPADVRAALAVFEFSQRAPEIWRGSNMLKKRRILETLSLNRLLGDVTLVLEKRRPFDELVKRPEIQLSRAGGI